MPQADLDSSLDAADYDPIDHLNAIFSHPSTLSAVPQTASALRAYQDDLDGEIERLVEQQSTSDTESVARIQTAKQDLSKLFRQIESVQSRALSTERSITDMTADIKRLDNTKKNLTLSMTALKRLQMLTTAYEQLQALISTRQYRECAQLLAAVVQLMAHFRTYRSIDQIATLSRNVADVQRELLEQVCEDFEVTFAKGEVAGKRGMLAEGCLVMDALGEQARSRLVTWYCNTQLREYRQVFRGDEAGSLDNISRRYAWFKRLLKTYDEEHAALFPGAWRVDESLANAFCEGTREDFKAQLAKSVRRSDGQSLDPKLLLDCFEQTLEFEHGLERKFTNSSRASLDTVMSSEEKPQPFAKAISEAFEPYLSVWVEAQDKALATMIPKYKAQPPRPADEEFNPQMVIPSSSELFNFYRHTFAQAAKLSTGARLVELAKVFAKYLDQYAQQVLLHYLSEKPGGAGGTPSKRASIEDTVLVLNTADYCYSTSTQLEERIKARVDDSWKDMIDLQSQADAFMGIASAAVKLLVRRVEVDLEPAWREMRNTGWARMQAVEDTSGYVPELVKRVKERATEVLTVLHKQQYARAFCDNVVESVAVVFTANITQCRPISEIGAEQMLLDSYTLTTELSTLPSLSASDPSSATIPASYTKRVQSAMARPTPLLKTLQVRPAPPESLVQAYLIHVADKSDTNFKKLLDLKGVRTKGEQAPLLELFAAHKDAPRYADLPAQNAALTPLLTAGSAQALGSGPVSASVAAGGAPGGVTSPAASALSGFSTAGAAAAANLSSLQGRFDASSLGTVLRSAAGGGGGGGGGGGSEAVGARAVSPPPAAGVAGLGVSGVEGVAAGAGGNVNQNLRNIGKFFKRDLGGFGGRFGKGSQGSEEGK